MDPGDEKLRFFLKSGADRSGGIGGAIRIVKFVRGGDQNVRFWIEFERILAQFWQNWISVGSLELYEVVKIKMAGDGFGSAIF